MKNLLRLMNTPEDIFDYAYEYIVAVLRKTARILLTQFHGLRHCHLFTTPQRLFSVMPACPIPCCKITDRKIFCGDAIGFKQIPVSYTHLDVYKRQAIKRLRAMMTRSGKEAVCLGVTNRVRTDSRSRLSICLLYTSTYQR